MFQVQRHTVESSDNNCAPHFKVATRLDIYSTMSAAAAAKEARVAASGVCNSGKDDSDKEDSADDGSKNAPTTMTTFDVRRGMADLRKMFHTQTASLYTERMPRLQHLSAANFCIKVVLTTLSKRRARSALKKKN
jgi:hypothetical protein